MKTFPILLILLACVTGCDPGVQYSRIIQNSSSHEIYLIKKNYPVCDTTIIVQGEEYIVYQHAGLGTTDEYEDCYFKENKSDTFLLEVKDDPSLTVNADIISNTGWQFSVIKRSKITHGGICSCRLTITEDMIN